MLSYRECTYLNVCAVIMLHRCHSTRRKAPQHSILSLSHVRYQSCSWLDSVASSHCEWMPCGDRADASNSRKQGWTRRREEHLRLEALLCTREMETPAIWHKMCWRLGHCQTASLWCCSWECKGMANHGAWCPMIRHRLLHSLSRFRAPQL